jgi:hypothetical protein
MNILLSMATIQERPGIFKTVTQAGCRVLLDSGAYTNFNRGAQIVTIQKYIRFIEKNFDKLWRYVNLDVIGDPEKSRTNFREMTRHGLNPVPVITPGISIKELKEINDSETLVAIGGTARMKPASKMEVLRIYHAAGLDLRRSHILGCSNAQVIHRFRPASFDSCTFSLCSANGAMLEYDPRIPALRQVMGKQPGNVHPKILNAIESFKFAKDAATWGSTFFFVVGNTTDFRYIQEGRQIYED